MQLFEYGQKEIDHLKKRDKKLGSVIDAIGLLERPVNTDVFASLVESIVRQQISNKAAETVANRLLLKAGQFTPESLDDLSLFDVQQCGMSQRKAGYIKDAAKAALDGQIDFKQLYLQTDEDIIKSLTALHGVGVWTAEMLLIFSLCRPDVVSFGDLAIRRGMMRLYNLPELTKADFLKYRKRYSPYGSVASFYLWQLSE